MGAVLNVPVILVSRNSKKYQPRWTDYVINWGCSKEWDWINNTNKRGHGLCVNKLNFFQHIKTHNNNNPDKVVNIPEWTTDGQVAAGWNYAYFARTILNGHSGQGIVQYGANEVPVKAPLYVKYKKKKHEYRVHFFKDKQGVVTVVDVTQKKRRKDAEFLDNQIRNHKNGWVYAREAVTEPKDLRQQATNAALASDLDFGAVDLIWNEHEDTSYVLEINTAPGLVGTTLQKYVETFAKDISK